MLRKPLYQVRENHQEHLFMFNEDLTQSKIEFGVKADKSIGGIRYASKSYTPGGPVNGISVSYNPAEGTSTVLVTVLKADTMLLTMPKYLYALNKVDPAEPENVETIASDIFNLELNPLTSFDSIDTVLAPEYADQVSDKKMSAVFSSGHDNLGYKERDAGFNTSLAFERIGTGLYRLTSHEDIFSNHISVSIFPLSPASYQKRYMFGWQYLSEKVMLIQATDFMEGNADLDFRVIIERIRS